MFDHYFFCASLIFAYKTRMMPRYLCSKQKFTKNAKWNLNFILTIWFWSSKAYFQSWFHQPSVLNKFWRKNHISFSDSRRYSAGIIERLPSSLWMLSLLVATANTLAVKVCTSIDPACLPCFVLATSAGFSLVFYKLVCN